MTARLDENGLSGEKGRLISRMLLEAFRAKKKERRRKSGRPSSMSLSEEGSPVFCIDSHAGNRSNLFEGEGSNNKRKGGL